MVTLLTNSAAYYSGAATHAHAVTITAGQDRMVLAFIGVDGNATVPAATGVTLNGVAPTWTLASEGPQTNGAARAYRKQVYAWRESDIPASGNLVWTTTATTYWSAPRVLLYSGARQVQPTYASANKGGSPAPNSGVSGPASIVSDGTGIVIDHLWQFYGDITTLAPDAGQTLQGTVDVLAGALVNGTSVRSAPMAGANNMSWTNTSWANEMQICMLSAVALGESGGPGLWQFSTYG